MRTELVHTLDGHDFACRGEGCQFCACGDNPSARRTDGTPAAAVPPSATPPSSATTRPAPAPVVRFDQLAFNLRDLFAAQAMVGILAGRAGYHSKEATPGLARMAYATADAMLAERATREGGPSS